MTTKPTFSLADMEAFDPQSSTRTADRERRFLCPLCGDGKRRDAAHRSLCANLESGVWNCKRCGATGKLTDFWTERPKSNPREIAHLKRRQLSALPEPKPKEPDNTSAANWRDQLRGNRALNSNGNGAAETYLRGRGIDLETSIAAGAMFAPRFYGAPAVTFPICERDGQQTGASGRYINANATPKTRIAGTKRNGVFCAPFQLPSGRILRPFDKDAPAVIVTEAPIDALSIATAGYPALALCGTSGAAWLHLACGLKRVVLAFDADDAGDNAAAALAAVLTPYGARCERLRPKGAKDWNEALQHDFRLKDWLAHKVL